MEQVIETYLLPPDEQHPVVCFDESPFQLPRQVREPQAAAPGRPRREDYEYERCGTAEVMMLCQPALGLRKCLVRQHRKKPDFAAVCQEVDAMFPAADKITLVCDNLNTHTLGALYATFPAEQARRLARKIDIVHTPQAWLVAEHRRAGVRGAGQDRIQEEDCRPRAVAARARRDPRRAKRLGCARALAVQPGQGPHEDGVGLS